MSVLLADVKPELGGDGREQVPAEVAQPLTSVLCEESREGV